MGAIGPGDWVERLPGKNENVFESASGRSGVVVGGVYRVREVLEAAEPGGGRVPALRLCGIVALAKDGREGAFRASNYRPIYRPKADLIETLMTPVPLGVPA